MHRESGLKFLREIDDRLSEGGQLCRSVRGMADAAIMPFVRQFAAVDGTWFNALALPHLRTWLDDHLASELFKAIMMRAPPWSPGEPPVFFPAVEH
jgi:glutathione S-transferase